jgi:hypothetical protein
VKNGILEESWRASVPRFILLSRVEAHGALIPAGEHDEIGPAADRAVLGESLAASPLGSTKTSLFSPKNAQLYVTILILHAIMPCKKALPGCNLRGIWPGLDSGGMRQPFAAAHKGGC